MDLLTDNNTDSERWSTTLHNTSPVVTTDNIFFSENGSTGDTSLLPATSEPTILTAVLNCEEGTSGWLCVADVLEKIVFVCACVGLLFNLSNIITIIISKLYQKTMYKLLISQAASNALTALAHGMARVSLFFLEGNTEIIINICSYNIAQIGPMTCAFTYTLLSLELYYKVILPFKHRELGYAFNVALILIWIVPVILTESIQIVKPLIHKQPEETFMEVFVRLQDNTLGFINTGLALVCLLVVVYLNVVSLKAVHRSLRNKAHEGKSTKKSTITIVAMITTYIIFYLPNWILGILFLLQHQSIIDFLPSLAPDQRIFLITCLSNLKIMNTISDPVIYVVRINAIRETYMRLIRKLKFH